MTMRTTTTPSRTVRTTITTAALAALTCLAFADAALARGGAFERPKPRPEVPGKSGATGGKLLEERRRRTRRLNELSGQNRDEASRSTPTRPAPTPARPSNGGRRRGGEVPMPPPTPDTSLVHLHHGRVRMFEGLARVDLTLEVQNVGSAVMEWRKTYAIDPAAEVIGAVLERRNQSPIHARTLTRFDALQCYSRVRMPPPTRERRPRRPRDPLLVTRPQRDQLAIQIWPIAADETIRVELTFVTPLRGEGVRRTYRDVMGGPMRETPRPADRPSEREGHAPRPGVMVGHEFVDHRADWLMQPGELVLSSVAPDGMHLDGEVAGQLKFTGIASTRRTEPAPSVPFLAKRRSTHAQLTGERTLSARVAVFRFDPAEYLKRKGFVLARGMQLELKAVRGRTRRLAPNRFAADGEPRPVAGQLVKAGDEVFPFAVRVLDRHGNEVVTFDEAKPLARPELDEAMRDAVGGWHRAQLAKRVFDWAGVHGGKRDEAVRYAVDLGVLMPGIAAIAIPANERERLTPRLRRLYSSDGVPLGAPRREADVKQPPAGAFEDDFRK